MNFFVSLETSAQTQSIERIWKHLTIKYSIKSHNVMSISDWQLKKKNENKK